MEGQEGEGAEDEDDDSNGEEEDEEQVMVPLADMLNAAYGQDNVGRCHSLTFETLNSPLVRPGYTTPTAASR